MATLFLLACCGLLSRAVSVRTCRYGGWVAPNIFYLGYAGVVNFGGFRIAGLSGIYNERHYKLGHFERPPYNDSSQRSAYHVREYETFQLSQLRQPIDVFLSHGESGRCVCCGCAYSLLYVYVCVCVWGGGGWVAPFATLCLAHLSHS
jgi:hypothetical protein